MSATSISADTVRIVATGNTFTAPATIDDYARLKAAEETLARGYDDFEIMDENDNTIEGYESFGVVVGRMPVHNSTQTFVIKMSKGSKPENSSQTWFDAKDMKRKMEAKVAADRLASEF